MRREEGERGRERTIKESEPRWLRSRLFSSCNDKKIEPSQSPLQGNLSDSALTCGVILLHLAVHSSLAVAPLSLSLVDCETTCRVGRRVFRPHFEPNNCREKCRKYPHSPPSHSSVSGGTSLLSLIRSGVTKMLERVEKLSPPLF